MVSIPLKTGEEHTPDNQYLKDMHKRYRSLPKPNYDKEKAVSCLREIKEKLR